MTEEERRRQAGTVEYVPTYGEYAAAQNAQNAAGNIAAGVMPTTYAQGGAYTPTAATPGTTPGTTYGENMDGMTVRQMIEEQRKISYAEAANDRERATVDARTAYAQNKATYGANAEALAGMGLTGGGYGDYLNSQAYAQQRQEIQAANAGEAAATREADRVYYADMMAQKEKEEAEAKTSDQEQKNIYSSLFDMAKSGAYSGEEIREMAAKMGYASETDIEWLASRADIAKTDAETSKAGTAYINVLAQAKTGNYTADEIIDYAKKSGVTDQADLDALAAVATAAQSNIRTEKDTAAADKQNAAYVELLAEAKKGTFTADEIKNMAKALGITDETKLGELASAATAAQSNVETDKSNKINAAYAEGLAMAESGDYSEATIEAWAKGQGITDQGMIDALTKAAKVAAQKKQSDEERAEADSQNLAYAQLMGDVRVGKYTTADIYSVAKAMGITDETMLMNLTELANEVERKGEDTNFADVLLQAQSGNYSAQAIEALAKAYGITDEERINELLAAGKDARSEKQKNVLSSSIYADTTDEEIDKMVADGELDKENVQAAKDARTEAAADAISEAVNSRDYAAADALVEKYYKSGAYSADERQNYYMDKLTSGIEYAAQNGDISAETVKSHEQALEKAKNEGKISQADYDAAKKYLYETVTTVVDSGNINLEWKSGGMGYKNFDITINGETVKMASPSDKPVEKEISNVLDMVTNNSPSEGTFAIYDDGLYVYLDSHDHSGWYKASRNVFNEGIVSSLANKRIYDIIKNDIKPKTASPTRPEHKVAK